jgi:hypothetical protein
MTEYEALKIEEAAYLMLLAVVDAGFGSDDTKALRKHFPMLHPDVAEEPIILQTVRELLERLPAWTKVR